MVAFMPIAETKDIVERGIIDIIVQLYNIFAET